MNDLDHRLNVYRDDLADERLAGRVKADKFEAGWPAVITSHLADLLESPKKDAPLLRQAIYGERVTVFEENNGFSWVQRDWDGYVGYVQSNSLGERNTIPTHRIIVPRTFLYSGADLRFPRCGCLSMGSEICVVDATETRGTQYSQLVDGNWIVSKHISSVEEYADDFIEVAKTLMYTPYLWGGNTGFGLDCAGLLQLSMMMTGRVVAADSDLQAVSIGEIIDTSSGFDDLQRGDLIFWRGHIGIMEDAKTLLHSSGHTMNVASEPYKQAIERIAYLYEMPTLARRP